MTVSSFRPEIYAIDFGTTNSLLVAANADAVTEPVPLDPSAPDPTLFRTLMYFPHRDHCYYGAEALKAYVEHEMVGRFIRSVKKHLPLRSFVGTYIEDRPLNLEDLIGLFLREMKLRADRHFGADVTRVVLGRPARFAVGDAEDRFAEARLHRAARNAGFKEISFCPEPVAAGRDFAGGLEGERLVVVGDFGGGTSDFTVMRLGGHEFHPEDVLAVGGVSVAGDLLDGALMRHRVCRHFGADVTYTVPMGSNVLTMPVHLMERLCSPADISLLNERDTLEFFKQVKQASLGKDDRAAMDRLFTLVEDQLGFSVFEAIEACKRALSDSEAAELHYRYPGIDLSEHVLRIEFEDYSKREWGKILDALDATMAKAGTQYGDIDVVCLTGGTARVPVIARGFRDRFGAEKLRQFRNFHSVVAGLGARARERL
ncbi:MAG: Hsp70 family protein [Bdellovibrionales bacterium]|nr:Hsp70 family protein [Bdellovibrionales bacterium]